MPAYWVARSKITDPVAYKKYTDRIPAIMQKYGGKVLARGGKYQIMEGPENFHRFVVIEFPSYEAALACWHSPDYQEVLKLRRDASEADLLVIEGYDGPQPEPAKQ